MADFVLSIARLATVAFEAVALAVIVGGFFAALLAGARLVRTDRCTAYEAVRRTFGRSVLLGLEVLVAADLIRTVAVEPSLASLAVLAGLVAIRTFLSWSFEVEIEGRWPWRRAETTSRGDGRLD